jgi:hypothetical protein
LPDYQYSSAEPAGETIAFSLAIAAGASVTEARLFGILTRFDSWSDFVAAISARIGAGAWFKKVIPEGYFPDDEFLEDLRYAEEPLFGLQEGKYYFPYDRYEGYSSGLALSCLALLAVSPARGLLVSLATAFGAAWLTHKLRDADISAIRKEIEKLREEQYLSGNDGDTVAFSEHEDTTELLLKNLAWSLTTNSRERVNKILAVSTDL